MTVEIDLCSILQRANISKVNLGMCLLIFFQGKCQNVIPIVNYWNGFLTFNPRMYVVGMTYEWIPYFHLQNLCGVDIPTVDLGIYLLIFIPRGNARIYLY